MFDGGSTKQFSLFERAMLVYFMYDVGKPAIYVLYKRPLIGTNHPEIGPIIPFRWLLVVVDGGTRLYKSKDVVSLLLLLQWTSSYAMGKG